MVVTRARLLVGCLFLLLAGCFGPPAGEERAASVEVDDPAGDVAYDDEYATGPLAEALDVTKVRFDRAADGSYSTTIQVRNLSALEPARAESPELLAQFAVVVRFADFGDPMQTTMAYHRGSWSCGVTIGNRWVAATGTIGVEDSTLTLDIPGAASAWFPRMGSLLGPEAQVWATQHPDDSQWGDVVLDKDESFHQPAGGMQTSISQCTPPLPRGELSDPTGDVEHAEAAATGALADAVDLTYAGIRRNADGTVWAVMRLADLAGLEPMARSSTDLDAYYDFVFDLGYENSFMLRARYYGPSLAYSSDAWAFSLQFHANGTSLATSGFVDLGRSEISVMVPLSLAQLLADLSNVEELGANAWVGIEENDERYHDWIYERGRLVGRNFHADGDVGRIFEPVITPDFARARYAIRLAAGRPTGPGVTEPHVAISIWSDQDFQDPQNGVRSGTGTAEDPYVVSNWAITERGSLSVINTTAHFVVRDCALASVALRGVEHARIEQNVITGEYLHPFHVSRSRDVTIQHNDISLDGLGVKLVDSSKVRFLENRVSGGHFYQVLVGEGSTDFLVEGNDLDAGEGGASEGILVAGASDGAVSGNLLRHDFTEAIAVWASTGVKIEGNFLQQVGTAIDIQNAQSIQVVANQIWRPNLQGINAHDSAANAVPAGGGPGPRNVPNSTEIVIRDNLVVSPWWVGIAIGIEGGRVLNNSIQGGEDGILLCGGNGTVADNRITVSQTGLAICSNSTGNVITRNTVSGEFYDILVPASAHANQFVDNQGSIGSHEPGREDPQGADTPGGGAVAALLALCATTFRCRYRRRRTRRTEV